MLRKILSIWILFYPISLFGQAPIIDDFSPQHGLVGSTVFIKGSNFDPIASNNVVRFGGVIANVVDATSTQLRVTVPSGVNNDKISVTVNGLLAYSAKPFQLTFIGKTEITGSSFGARIDIPASDFPWDLELGDLDDDGRSDLQTPNQLSALNSVIQNQSTPGNISFLPKFDLAVPQINLNVEMADMDMDGKLDLVSGIGGNTNPRLSIHKNISTPGTLSSASFEPRVDLSPNVGGNVSIKIADLDLDGKPDIIAEMNSVSVFRNITTPGTINTSSFEPRIGLTPSSGFGYIETADLDMDGRPDVIATDYNNDRVIVYRNTSSPGSISFDAGIILVTGDEPSVVTAGDIDGDGKPEIAVTNFAENTVSVFHNTSSGSISFDSKFDFTPGTAPFGITLGDLNGDAKLEMLVTNVGNLSVSVFQNTSVTGTIDANTFAMPTNFPTSPGPRGVEIGDVDSDGKPDILVACQTANSISVIPNQIQPADVLSTDSLALVALYQNTDGPNWTNNTNWLTGPVDTWNGITVTGSRITEVQLFNNNLNGTIPTEIGDLDGLVDLNFQNNQLNGNIPAEIGGITNLNRLDLSFNSLSGPIPSDIGNLNNLQELILSGNQLSGSIPPEIGNLNNLTDLELYFNQLTGNIPPELGNLNNVGDFFLFDNQLSGSIPSDLGNLNSVRGIILRNNQLTGSIPIELGNLSNMIVLDLGGNQLSGSIPVEIGNLINLTWLSLPSNQISGAIPSEIGNLSSLQRLYLFNNQLTGNLPLEIGSLSNLIELEVSLNQLSGQIPAELGNLVNLERLFLNFNQFTGSIPSELGNLGNLDRLALNVNQLSGTIPAELGNLSNLTIMDLNSNLLTGSIPPEIGNLSNLDALFLSENELSGTIPLEIINLSNLKSLGLNSNMLSGLIPPELGNLNLLVDLRLNDNILSGPIPPEIGNLSNLNSLRLNDNLLEGNIPISLTNLDLLIFLFFNTTLCEPVNPAYQSWKSTVSNYQGTNLFCNDIYTDSLALVQLYQSTDGPNWTNNSNWLTGPVNTWFGIDISSNRVDRVQLSANNLNGPLPAEIGDLTALTELRLDVNLISGNLPPEIGNLNILRLLDLSANNLTGPIPSEIDNLLALQTLFLGSNQLSGNLLEELFNLSNLQSLVLNTNSFSGTIPSSIGSLTNLLSLSLSNNEFTGTIPPEIGNLNQLVLLGLGNNLLQGTIPDELYNLIGLNILDLSNNDFSGTISQRIANLTDLSQLFLGDNILSGELPDGFWSLENMIALQLQNNDFTGSISNEIGNWNNLQFLDLSFNQFEGSVPEGLMNTPIQTLLINDNQFNDLVDLSASPTILDLSAANNNFEFDDLEPNIGIVSFTYIPQGVVSEFDSLLLIESDPYMLDIPVGGSSNQYQWFKDGNPLASATTESLDFNSLELTDGGRYILEVTNSIVPGLTLTTEEIVLNVVKPSNIVVEIDGNPKITGSLVVFRNTTLGKSREQQVVVQNPGDFPLFVIDIEVTGDFLLLDSIPDPIPAGGSTEVLVEFRPTELGERNGIMTITSNGDVPVYELSLVGKAAATLEAFNVVTPFQDGKHDFLKILNIQFYPDNRVTIYNRWGDEVFSIDNYDNIDRVFTGLDNSGRELPDGNYFFVIDPNDGTDAENGYLYLRR